MAEATQPYASYTPTVFNVTTSDITAMWHTHGDWVTVEFTLTMSAAPTGEVSISLPATASTGLGTGLTKTLGTCGGAQGGTVATGTVYLASSTTVKFEKVDGTIWNIAVPVAWAAGGILRGTFTYRKA